MLTFGIIGTNWITHSFVQAAQATAKWTLKAVYSRHDSTAQDFAAHYPTQSITTYTDLSALASAPLDAVYIASPNTLHFAQAKQLLAAGKHVILEKPICTCVAELDELFALAKQHHVFLLEAWRHIQEPNFHVLKASLPRLGRIHGASITYAQFSSRYDKLLAGGDPPNIFRLDMGAGALADLGAYTVAAAVALFGPPASALYFPVRVATGADGAGSLVLSYDGFSVLLCASKMWDSDAPSEVYGERGTLVVPSITDIESVVFWDPRAKTREELGVKKDELALRPEAEEFARIIEAADWEAAGVLERHSREVLKVTEGVRKANGLLFPGEKKEG